MNEISKSLSLSFSDRVLKTGLCLTNWFCHFNWAHSETKKSDVNREVEHFNGTSWISWFKGRWFKYHQYDSIAYFIQTYLFHTCRLETPVDIDKWMS